MAGLQPLLGPMTVLVVLLCLQQSLGLPGESLLTTAEADACKDANHHLGLLQRRAQSLVVAQEHAARPATGGLKAEFFYLTNEPSQLSDVGFTSNIKADLTRIDPNIDYPSSNTAWNGLGRMDHFAARWTGSLRID
eukprot:1078480-Amphidinium_carterae.1